MKFSKFFRVGSLLTTVGIMTMATVPALALDEPIWNPTGEHGPVQLMEGGRPRFSIQKIGLEGAYVVMAVEKGSPQPIRAGIVSFTQESAYRATPYMEHTQEVIAWANRAGELDLRYMSVLHEDENMRWYEMGLEETPRWTPLGGWSIYVALDDGNYWNFEIDFSQCKSDYWAQEVEIDLEALRAGMSEEEWEWKMSNPMFLDEVWYGEPRELSTCTAKYYEDGAVRYVLTESENEWEKAAQEEPSQEPVEPAQEPIQEPENSEMGKETNEGGDGAGGASGGATDGKNEWGGGVDLATMLADVRPRSFVGNEILVVQRGGAVASELEPVSEVDNSDEAGVGNDDNNESAETFEDEEVVEVPELGDGNNEGGLKWWMVATGMILLLGVGFWWIIPILKRRKEEDE